ncbi:MAG: hypothetical protein IT445_20375 [Phycisphaeraceae bacterium]|nr:hypothetical protein [Phycisphaeraceae bacterium]
MMRLSLIGCVMSVLVLLSACATAPTTKSDREILAQEVQLAIKRFKEVDPSMAERFENAKAYAVFPSVGKGAVGVGGAFGRGQLFEDGQVTGWCDLSQGSIGFQLGGQAYSEVIFFENENSLEQFKAGSMEFSAQASAVAATAGASTDANYEYGVLVFTLPKGGLMYEASIGGQRFTFIKN